MPCGNKCLRQFQSSMCIFKYVYYLVQIQHSKERRVVARLMQQKSLGMVAVIFVASLQYFVVTFIITSNIILYTSILVYNCGCKIVLLLNITLIIVVRFAYLMHICFLCYHHGKMYILNLSYTYIFILQQYTTTFQVVLHWFVFSTKAYSFEYTISQLDNFACYIISQLQFVDV